MLIRYNATNIYRCNPLVLIPGINEIKETIWNMVKDHPLVKHRIHQGEIVLQVSEAVSKEVSESELQDKTTHSSLKGLSLKEAKEYVQSTFSETLLETWQQEETRSQIRKAIEEQLKAIQEQYEAKQVNAKEGEAN